MAEAPRSLRIGVAQFNAVVGDLEANTAKALAVVDAAGRAGADLVVFGELALTGYPPEDLVLKPGFVADTRAALEKFAAGTGRTAAVVGFVDGGTSDERSGHSRSASAVPDLAGIDFFNDAYNAAAVCAGGKVHGVYRKRHLPNYDVFDELRQFRPGDQNPELFVIGGAEVGVTLCEDSWIPGGPVVQLAELGARVVVNLNGSPFRSGKQPLREQVIAGRAEEACVPVVYVNLVGGQDELVFDGGSFVASPLPGSGPALADAGGPADSACAAEARVTARCASFAESLDVFDIALPEPRPASSEVGEAGPAARPCAVTVVTAARPAPQTTVAAPLAARLEPLEAEWEALVLGVRDYVRKSGFEQVCIGLSGGVDSSATAAVATDALGADNVHGLLMPSRYSSDHSVADSAELGRNLGFSTRTVPISEAHTALAAMLAPHMAEGVIRPGDITDQNLQSRVRGVVLMAYANEHGLLVLTTANKSETAVGYSTLFGDSAGAFCVLCDVWKTRVYELCAWRNARAKRPWIPESVLAKAPSAELRPDQRDDQSLPPYEILDPILRAYVEDDRTAAEIIELGIAGADPETVSEVCRLVDISEYKRRMSPLGPRITSKAFGRDRRMPIVNRYRG